MFRTAAVLGLGLAAACSAAAAPAPQPAPGWRQLMQQVDADLAAVAVGLQEPAAGDLRVAAQRARAAADAVARGYGELERREVPGFAELARETESWLLQLGLEAGQGHVELARQLLRQGDQRYCARCHLAAGLPARPRPQAGGSPPP